MKVMFSILWCIIWPFFNLVHPCKAIGRENIPEGAALLCPNHTGLSDPLFVTFAMGLKIKPRVMAKAELLRVPVIGFLLEKAGIFAVDRGKSDVAAVKTALRCLKEGNKLLIFPEGTRSKTGEMGEAKTGVAMFATKTNSPIVPIYIPAEKKWFRRTPVVFGKPFLPTYEGKKATSEDYERISDELMARIAALKELAQ